MAHVISHHDHHAHTGEVIWSLLGLAAVAVTVLAGMAWLAQNALQGVFALFSGI